MMDIKSESTCENQSLSLSNSNFDQAKAQEMLITPHVLDPLTPHSSGWDHQIHSTHYTVFYTNHSLAYHKQSEAEDTKEN